MVCFIGFQDAEEMNYRENLSDEYDSFRREILQKLRRQAVV